MNKKAIKYTIIFLVVPLILSLSIAIATDNKGFSKENAGYDGMNISNQEEINTTVGEIKRSNTYIYFCLFSLITISAGALVYIKQKRGI